MRNIFFNYFKKICIIIFFSFVLVITSSCKKNTEISELEEFSLKYYEIHKDGYEVGPKWYEFKSTNIKYNSNTGTKMIKDEYYIGELDLDKDRFIGGGNVCKYKSTEVELVNNDLNKKTEELVLLSNGNYFSSKNVYIPKNDEYKFESFGSKKIKKVGTNFNIFEDIFNPKLIEVFLSTGWLYDYIEFNDNYLKILTHNPVNHYQEDTLTEYWFDDDFVIYQVRRTITMTFDSEFEADNNYNYLSIATLKITNPVIIDVPEEYDSEFESQFDSISFSL